MKTPKLLTVCLTLGIVSSCAPPANSYQGFVQTHRVDGKIFSIDVKFPNQNSQYPTNLNSKEKADKMIEQLEKMVKDIKAARDEME